MQARPFSAAALFAAAASLLSPPAQAETYVSAPRDWEINLQPMVTEVGHRIVSLHNGLVIIITAITVFVLALMIYVCWRFNEKNNPTPSKTTHSTVLEVAWTVVPILILLGIAIPSFRLLRYQLILPQGDITVKATGKSNWQWEYEYPKEQGGGFSYISAMLTEDERAKAIQSGRGTAHELPRLLAVDNELVLPVNKTVILQVTGEGIIHNFALPAFGLKIDAIPGRLNQTWFKAEREGIYYGQCSRLCGVNHAFMPIAIRIVSEQAYAQWLEDSKKKYGAIDAPSKIASAAAAVQ
ncbi:MAG: cytochrome c oxidase subunit II [Rhizobiales bacterium 65-9]|nr:cytochrome c oxidase subunit II [Hyphomicrobiales bacterium]OJY38214.1 MAG: cytochrome c oxidase subunit II [Rhizobiales bacterium 65-9]